MPFDWEKLSARLGDDPDGAIAAARTLLETVCLHILSMLRKGPNTRVIFLREWCELRKSSIVFGIFVTPVIPYAV